MCVHACVYECAFVRVKSDLSFVREVSVDVYVCVRDNVRVYVCFRACLRKFVHMSCFCFMLIFLH